VPHTPFGERLAAALKAQGVTQAELARSLGVNKSTVTYWVRGGLPEAQQLPKIAETTGTSIDFLLAVRSDDKPMGPPDLAALLQLKDVRCYGRPMSDSARKRAMLMLAGLLAPPEDLDKIVSRLTALWKEDRSSSANPDRTRARTLFTKPRHQRPRTDTLEAQQGASQGGMGRSNGGGP
jgi:transcriptional regulator with XRE-family HTH domain